MYVHSLLVLLNIPFVTLFPITALSCHSYIALVCGSHDLMILACELRLFLIFRGRLFLSEIIFTDTLLLIILVEAAIPSGMPWDGRLLILSSCPPILHSVISTFQHSHLAFPTPISLFTMLNIPIFSWLQ